VVWIAGGVIRAGTALRLLLGTAETEVTEAEPGREDPEGALVAVHCRGGMTCFPPLGKPNVFTDPGAATFPLVRTLGDNSLVRTGGDNSLVRTPGDNSLVRTHGDETAFCVDVARGGAVPLIICTGLAVRADLIFS